MRRFGIAIMSAGILAAAAVAAAWPTPQAEPALTQPATKSGADAKTGARVAAEATAPAKKAAPKNKKKCKAGEITLRAAECPKGARCRAKCVQRPKDGPTLLCPEGMAWASLACPKGARCLVGGRCKVTSHGGVFFKKGDAKAPLKDPAAAPAKAAGAAPKCKVGRVLTRVKCMRAPCDQLCLPARLDPSLKASPKVKAL